jgi:hypothetical protein
MKSLELEECALRESYKAIGDPLPKWGPLKRRLDGKIQSFSNSAALSIDLRL